MSNDRWKQINMRLGLFLFLWVVLVSSDWFKWGDSGPSVANAHWNDLIREGIELHSKYMHGRAQDLIVKTAKYHHSHQKEIISLLLDVARPMLADGPERDEVCARGCECFKNTLPLNLKIIRLFLNY